MENCYCSVQFQTGEELDEALLKAKTACDEAEKAVAAKEAIENMVVDSVVLPAGATPTVEKTTDDGSVKLTFGLVPGIAGSSGVYVGSEEPTDESVNVWIDTSGEATELLNAEGVSF